MNILFKFYLINAIMFWIIIYLITKLEKGKWRDMFNFNSIIFSIIPFVNFLCLILAFFYLIKINIYEPYIKEGLDKFLDSEV